MLIVLTYGAILCEFLRVKNQPVRSSSKVAQPKSKSECPFFRLRETLCTCIVCDAIPVKFTFKGVRFQKLDVKCNKKNASKDPLKKKLMLTFKCHVVYE